MAGHSHWAGIKHKKGKQDKERAKVFAKLSREITVAAKLGAKDPASNPRLRTAIQSARESNMPKDNIERAISKSEFDLNKNYENLRYEGFGPNNTALIIETLTENKNRTASNIRTILQKNGGRLGETGSTTHYFFNCGVIHVSKEKISEQNILEVSINAGAKECISSQEHHEVLTERKDFYKIKNEIESKTESILYSGIEWRPHTYLDISKEQNTNIIKVLEALEEDEDVQNTFVNCKFI
jgi:YebC/PmpR family DNA-binding regulatory protein|tara:strand:+ start:106 stop:825 length:720 start_codon:yes stop_codon:yes gene_type:complete